MASVCFCDKVNLPLLHALKHAANIQQLYVCVSILALSTVKIIIKQGPKFEGASLVTYLYD